MNKEFIKIEKKLRDLVKETSKKIDNAVDNENYGRANSLNNFRNGVEVCLCIVENIIEEENND